MFLYSPPVPLTFAPASRHPLKPFFMIFLLLLESGAGNSSSWCLHYPYASVLQTAYKLIISSRCRSSSVAWNAAKSLTPSAALSLSLSPKRTDLRVNSCACLHSNRICCKVFSRFFSTSGGYWWQFKSRLNNRLSFFFHSFAFFLEFNFQILGNCYLLLLPPLNGCKDRCKHEPLPLIYSIVVQKTLRVSRSRAHHRGNEWVKRTSCTPLHSIKLSVFFFFAQLELFFPFFTKISISPCKKKKKKKKKFRSFQVPPVL